MARRITTTTRQPKHERRQRDREKHPRPVDGFGPVEQLVWRTRLDTRTGRPKGPATAYLRLPRRPLEALRDPDGAPISDATPGSIKLARVVAAQRVTARNEEATIGAAAGVRPRRLGEYADHHLRRKAAEGRVTHGWLRAAERHLTLAVEHLGADTWLHEITPADVQGWLDWLATTPARRGGVGERADELTRRRNGGSLRQHLNSLSNMFKRAISDGAVPAGHNPAAALFAKPSGGARESDWLDADEAALLLEACRTYRPKRPDLALDCLHAVVATALLTGARPSEVLNLRVRDVSLERRTVRVRGGKTSGAERTVPLWPQLAEILRPILVPDNAPPPPLDAFLFTNARTGGRVVNYAKQLHAVEAQLRALGVRWRNVKRARLTRYTFRHTYTVARLQTLDHGAPVSVWTVARELGHRGPATVEAVYGHLGDVRHRADAVEYPAALARASFPDAVRALRARAGAAAAREGAAAS